MRQNISIRTLFAATAVLLTMLLGVGVVSAGAAGAPGCPAYTPVTPGSSATPVAPAGPNAGGTAGPPTGSASPGDGEVWCC